MRESQGLEGLVDQLKIQQKVLENRQLLDDASKNLDFDMMGQALSNLYSYHLFGSIDRLSECEQAAFRIGSLDFSKHVSFDDSNHCANYFAITLNMIMEELDSRIFPFQNEIINAVSDFIFVVDKQGKIMNANESLSTLTEYSIAELKNLHYNELLPGDHTFTLEHLPVGNIDISIKGKTSTTPVLLKISQHKNYNSNIQGYSFIARLKK